MRVVPISPRRMRVMNIAPATSPFAPSARGGFAVVDLETTGLDPKRDRILEIAIVNLDASGKSEAEWSSLVTPELSPGEKIGAQFIHGITEEDLRGAPKFAALLPAIKERLRGRAVVAHNARFDVSFLNAAFERVAFPFAIPEQATVCTMELSKIYLPAGRHSLVEASCRAGITVTEHHRALADAWTAAKLLQRYFEHEATGERYEKVAVSRDGRTFNPAAWSSALRAGVNLAWPDKLF